MTAADVPAVEVLVEHIRHELRAAADPSLAPGQQRYMKSAMPYLGVRVPAARRIARAAACDITDPVAIRAAARRLWDEASHREERYAALALLATKTVAGQVDSLPVVEHFIRTGQWWDYVDEAAHRLRELLDAGTADMPDLLRAWSRDEDFWIRRAAIIAQLNRGDGTDLTLLADVIEPNRDDPEFFIRKAIGWALRDAARAHPEWVRTYLARHDLSPLSRREAAKHL
ncbi:DNA alkylation repair protein [Branchiibius sp. NY16-3462-2]|uniref:DNA alkylation repair protein n=1 Tax=Branchiibius sp. NY16-3462-2 TaxID=1807500 RepID=UPI000797C55C|nr:DNA alkylation repair protein [Branchiibius sp. NY16-3462-2]KYH44545.1 DNA alkylation repair protein [Branchiibius sp. NY16-3462-2]